MTASKKSSGDRKQFLRVLKQKAYDCTVEEFKELLADFGHDAENLRVMQKAVNERMGDEDRGDYIDAPSAGYWPTVEKSEILDARRLEQEKSAVKGFNAAANDDPRGTRNNDPRGTRNNDPRGTRNNDRRPARKVDGALFAQIQKDIAALNARLDRLEKSQGKKPKKGPNP